MRKNSVALVAAALGNRTHSDLYRWLETHYAELEKARRGSGEKTPRSDWIRAAEELDKLGIRTRKGEALKAETVRRTWHRVQAAKTANPETVSPVKPAAVTGVAPVTKKRGLFSR